MRQKYKCVDCGLEVSGREGPDGKVYPYDRAPDAPGPPKPSVCIACHVKRTGLVDARPEKELG